MSGGKHPRGEVVPRGETPCFPFLFPRSQGLLALTHRPVMMEAENFTIFIKNSIRFPLFNFEK